MKTTALQQLQRYGKDARFMISPNTYLVENNGARPARSDLFIHGEQISLNTQQEGLQYLLTEETLEQLLADTELINDLVTQHTGLCITNARIQAYQRHLNYAWPRLQGLLTQLHKEYSQLQQEVELACTHHKKIGRAHV